MTAKEFVAALNKMSSEKELEKVQRFFREDKDNKGNKFIGVRMGHLFALAKKSMTMSLKEVEKLLQSPYYEARMGAVCIMDFQARHKKTTDETRKALYDLYIDNHDKINNWDMIDRSAPFVVGGYLFDKPRKILYKLAKSKNVWERRTSIVSTYYFLRQGEVDDTFAIAELLMGDKHDLIHKAVGSWIRVAGGRDKKRLLDFLDKYVDLMPRTMLRYATEKLNPKQREYYLNHQAS